MKYLKLNDNNKIPKIEFGVFQINDLNECENIITNVIKAGYRMFDNAEIYKNEISVDNAIKKVDQMFLQFPFY